jgi:hypothetical protein
MYLLFPEFKKWYSFTETSKLDRWFSGSIEISQILVDLGLAKSFLDEQGAMVVVHGEAT